MKWPWQREAAPDWEALREKLKGCISPKVCEALQEVILNMSSTERFLNIKDEMGMKGFWYMKGYIRGQRDVLRVIEAAAKAAVEASHTGPTP